MAANRRRPVALGQVAMEHHARSILGAAAVPAAWRSSFASCALGSGAAIGPALASSAGMVNLIRRPMLRPSQHNCAHVQYDRISCCPWSIFRLCRSCDALRVEQLSVSSSDQSPQIFFSSRCTAGACRFLTLSPAVAGPSNRVSLDASSTMPSQPRRTWSPLPAMVMSCREAR